MYSISLTNIQPNMTDMKEEIKFSCEICPYASADKRNFDRHNSSRKHLLKSMEHKQTEILLKLKLECNNCDRTFTNSSSLSRHKKFCNNELNINYEKKLAEKERGFQIKLLEIERECDKKLMEKDLKYQKELEKKLLKQETKYDNELKLYRIELKEAQIKIQQLYDERTFMLKDGKNYHKNLFQDT